MALTINNTSDTYRGRYRFWQTSLLFTGILLILSCANVTAHGTDQSIAKNDTENTELTPKEECIDTRQFTFSWSMVSDCKLQTRGGTTKGVKTVLDSNSHPGWQALKEEGISDFERDRRAILAMAGPYRVSFDFLETVGYTEGYAPSVPYQSWGTEYVYVVEDKGDFISLQHIMVMYFEGENGESSPPMVMKHWRQDWEYEKPELFVYAGYASWKQNPVDESAMKGKWAQSVYQVDDSPRYESFGEWEHHANFSTWISGKTWRPLPRREGSVRDDYDVLEGINRHTIVPSGWVQEEENLKLVLNDAAQPDEAIPYLAKELGVARYERIVEHDFSPGDEYWEKSFVFWKDVRAVWQDLMNKHQRIEISKVADKQYMFMPFFAKAQAIVEGAPYDSETGKEEIRDMLSPFIVTHESFALQAAER
ncbi:MAG: DUF6607 family protein [Pseudomonadota bacterium]